VVEKPSVGVKYNFPSSDKFNPAVLTSDIWMEGICGSIARTLVRRGAVCRGPSEQLNTASIAFSNSSLVGRRRIASMLGLDILTPHRTSIIYIVFIILSMGLNISLRKNPASLAGCNEYYFYMK
jgi:hypothetical protein